MRAGSIGWGNRRWAAAVALAVVIVCVAATGVAWAAGSQASPSGSPSAAPSGSVSSPSGSPATIPGGSASPSATQASPSGAQASPVGSPTPGESITWSLSPVAVVYGRSVTAQGTVTPAGAGQTVTVAVDGITVATADADASTGAFSATFVPVVGGTVTATLGDGTVAATSYALTVAPKVTLHAGASMPWGRTKLTITVAPASYDGLVTVTVLHHARKVATVSGHAAGGKLVVRVPTPGVGTFTVHVATAAAAGLVAAPVAKTTLTAGWRRLAVGSKGAYVRIMLVRLAALKFRVPGISSTFSVDAGDSVVAFQKAYGLPRTYVFDRDDWRKLDTAKVIRARHKLPATHIEIDKTRQILMIVKHGVPFGIIPVSTGATGNTPVGRFHILWKAPATSTWLGAAILFRTMDFYGNFAMHGYPLVPPYPASHGCVREPIWVANWTYVHSWVGETVYIYLS